MLVLLRKIFLRKKKPSLREKIEQYTEAITFAEAGLEIKKEALVKEKAKKARVIVVGNEHSFSKEVQDYSLGFAERLEYDILALNVGPIEKVTSLESHCESLCEQFKAECCGTADLFQQECERRGIRFLHLVKFGKIDSCLSEVYNEFDRVEFVIMEPKKWIGDRCVIPVFTVAP